MRVHGVPAVKALEVLMAPGADLLTLDDLLAVVRPAWHADAACRGIATGAFYRLTAKVPPAIAAICGSCPVRSQCREAGEREHGVWGGLTEAERRAERRAAA